MTKVAGMLLPCCLLPCFRPAPAWGSPTADGTTRRRPTWWARRQPTRPNVIQTQKVRIFFNEFIKIDNPTENVVVSPPQLEMPEIKAEGKAIVVELKDSLKPNTTYTIDFSDAITDNNEGNPLGNYTYSFSTGAR